MSNQLTPTTPLLPERFANPVRQIGSLLQQPAVRRSLPMIMMISLIAAAALAWMTLATPQQKTLFAGLPDSDKAAVTAALQQANITARIDQGSGALTVNEDDYSRARILLAGQGLPKAAPGGYQILDNLPMGVSRAVEGERLRQARETELARSIEEIDSVAEARVHLAMPETSVFVRDNASPSASVILKLQPGRSLAEAQVSSIINLVASSVPGMKTDAVTVVDQMGALLTHVQGQDSTTLAGDARIDFQRRIEDKYRTQLTQLLTPLVGPGNFSAEIQADVNLDETQATRESYDKQGTLRAEQGNWTGVGAAGAAQAPGGIPGALSNTATPASTVTSPGKPAAPATPPSAAGATPTPPPATDNPAKQAENYARAYDLGKEISVTRAMPGAIKRLSVAVLLRDPEGSKPRSPVEIQQITALVRAAVGYDPARNDQVTVIARKFAPSVTLDQKAAWYDSAWLPIVARNVTAILIAIMVLMLGVRPLSRALLKKRDDAPPPRIGVGAALSGGHQPSGTMSPQMQDGVPIPVSIEMIDGARNFDDRIGMVRGFTRDNPSRAALAVRDMIKADAS
ncbi:flagellar M-ring protein FliF [Sphingomonas sp. 28-63-12]|uniref:flagellar basal-body MS-ring/collar protein FliF n=1 Tax=Sphingomonas sp. 28-63-12 TaxID=1970434 RepID=UPI000BD15030|nr:MAG: flagellar M-ring protein FliF [Sphingomonas sp. 28-63-12]